jgi:murein L,D-transpeptidase YcbB/YkuD
MSWRARLRGPCLSFVIACGGTADPGSRPIAPAATHAEGAEASDAVVAAAIARLLAEGRHPRLARPDFHAERPALERLYGSPPRALWPSPGAGRPPAQPAIALLREAGVHGLVPDDYDVRYLQDAAAGLASRPAPAAPEVALFDVAVSLSTIRFLTDVHRGRADPRRAGFDYHAGERHDVAEVLGHALAANDLAAAVGEVEPAFVQYRRLKNALRQYRQLATDETLRPVTGVKTVRRGDAYSDLPRLVRRLQALGDLAAATSDPGSDVYREPLVGAVERFQARHGLAVDGILGPSTFRQLNAPLSHRVRQIELALERLRWLPHAPPGKFLAVNVPAFRLVALEAAASDRPALQMGIVVGRAARTRTPLFADAIRYVIFRPFWYPPRSIIVNEILPAVRRSPRYLAEQPLDLVARGDDQATPLAATPANLGRLATGSLRLRQRAGPHNALGRLKFVFPNSYDVYLHDTPARELFARPRRDFSHGCIRVENAAALAEFLLARQGGWTRERIEQAMDGERTVRVDLPAPVPVFIYYTTAIVRHDATVEFFEDIYGKDASLDRELHLARSHG